MKFYVNFKGQPGNEGRRGEPGIPGCNGTKVRTKKTSLRHISGILRNM